MTLKIAHVNVARGYRGGERQTELLIRALRGADVEQVLVARRGAPLASRLADAVEVRLVSGSTLSVARATADVGPRARARGPERVRRVFALALVAHAVCDHAPREQSDSAALVRASRVPARRVRRGRRAAGRGRRAQLRPRDPRRGRSQQQQQLAGRRRPRAQAIRAAHPSQVHRRPRRRARQRPEGPDLHHRGRARARADRIATYTSCSSAAARTKACSRPRPRG